MKHRLLFAGLLLAAGWTLSSGCAFLGGAAVGAGATAAGYEFNAKEQMDKLEAERRTGRISAAEYESRRRQIERGSVVY